MAWDVDVAAEGSFEVEIFYAVPKADVGAIIELAFGNQRITNNITEANEVPDKGAEHDRSPRMESYVKDFKSMKLGTIQLPKGKGQLVLSAPEIPGG